MSDKNNTLKKKENQYHHLTGKDRACRVTIDVTPCKYKKSKKSNKILIEQKNIYRKDFLL